MQRHCLPPKGYENTEHTYPPYEYFNRYVELSDLDHLITTLLQSHNTLYRTNIALQLWLLKSIKMLVIMTVWVSW